MNASLILLGIGALGVLLCMGLYVRLRSRSASLDWGPVALATIAGAFAAAVMFDTGWFL